MVLVVGLSAGLAAASAATPNVSGPVSGGLGAIQPPNLTTPDLAQLGYQGSEYFLDGTATAYTATTPLPTDGTIAATPASTAPYKTRSSSRTGRPTRASSTAR